MIQIAEIGVSSLWWSVVAAKLLNIEKGRYLSFTVRVHSDVMRRLTCIHNLSSYTK